VITAIKDVFSIILFLIFFGVTSSIALQKTAKWIKREAIVKIHKGLSPLSDLTKSSTQSK
jgi:hypothetical protein